MLVAPLQLSTEFFFLTRISASYAEDGFTCKRVEKRPRFEKPVRLPRGCATSEPRVRKNGRAITSIGAATNCPAPYRHSSCPLLLGPPSPPLPPALGPFSFLPWMPTKSGQGKISDRIPYYQDFNPVIPPMLLSLYFGSTSPHSANPRVAMMDGSSQPSTSSTHSPPPLVRVSAS